MSGTESFIASQVARWKQAEAEVDRIKAQRDRLRKAIRDDDAEDAHMFGGNEQPSTDAELEVRFDLQPGDMTSD